MKVKRFLLILGAAAIGLPVGIAYRAWLKSLPFCDNWFSDHYTYIGHIEQDPPDVVEQKTIELMSCVRREIETGKNNWPVKKALDGLMLVARRLPQKEDEVVALYLEVIDRRSYGYSLAIVNLPHFCRSRKNIESSIDCLRRYLGEENPKFAEDAEECVRQLEKLLVEVGPGLPAAPQPGK